MPYFLAREFSSRQATRFMVNLHQPDKSVNLMEKTDYASLNGKTILRRTYGNTVSYFLRLPDGSRQGTGYPGTGYQSLELLWNHNSAITSVDKMLTLSGKSDATSLLSALAKEEAEDIKALDFNITETDLYLNPDSHPDHYTTSYIMQTVAKDFPSVNMRFYIDYHSSLLPANLKGQDLDFAIGVWGVVASERSRHYYSDTWTNDHLAWLPRCYTRESIQTSSSPCDYKHSR